jgi:uncharacterized protein YecE (DUF72 family)
MLSTLASYLDFVEIDSTREQPLRPESALVWLNAVKDNPRFQFTALMDRTFTHDRKLDDARIRTWKRGLQPLRDAGKLGAVVMTFPWGFRYTAENREFLVALRRAFHEYLLVAEFRHESWILDEAITTLIDYRIGLVNIDQPEYFRALPPAALLTGPIAYVRMHGRLGADTAKDFHTRALPPYLYSNTELEQWRPRVERLTQHAASTYVAFTNSAGARSLVNTLMFASLLGETQQPAPPELMEHYWRELAGFRSRRPVQPRLAA